jgi:WD40 repeat protein
MRARDRRLRRIVAIKLMRKLSPALEARFRCEAEITARLQHPGIVPVHDVGRWPTGEPFYAMKLVAGASLAETLAGLPSLPERLLLLPRLLAVCDTMGYVHSQRVIHRDLKPANIMIGNFGETLIIDWGLARELDRDERDTRDGDDTASRPEATAAGQVVGTPAFMPLEQARGERLDSTADVYSLGCVLYQLLSGRLPFTGASSKEVIEAVLHSQPPPVTALVPDVPRELAAITTKAMARDRRLRYRDAHELADDLKRYLDGQLVGAHQYSSWQLVRRFWQRNWRVLSPLALALLALIGVGSYSVRRIVRERRAAVLARADAEAQRTRLYLAQAKLWLDRDATVALAWLKQYAAAPEARAGEIVTVAADARAHGVASQLVRERHKVVLAPDGKTLVGLSGTHLIAWSPDDTRARTLGTIVAPLNALVFADDGRTVYSAEGGLVRAWPSDGSAAPRQLHHSDEAVVQLVALGAGVAAGGERGSVWRFGADGTEQRLPLEHHAPIAELLGTRDGTTLVSRSRDRDLRWWRAAGNTTGHLDAAAERAALSASGRYIAWGRSDGKITLFDTHDNRTRQWQGHREIVPRVAFSDDERQLASSSGDHTIRVWNVAGGEPRVLEGHSNWTQRVVFATGQPLLASTSLDRTVRVWNLATGDCAVLRGHVSPVDTLQFTPDARQLVTGDRRGEVRVWPLERAGERVLHAHAGDDLSLGFLPEGDLVTNDSRGGIRVWTAGSDQPRVISAVGGDRAFDLSPDGKRAADAGSDGVLWLHDLASGTRAARRAHEGKIYALAFSPDGNQIASAGADHTVRLWDRASDTATILRGHTLPVWHVAFSPREPLIASAGDDLALRLWDRAAGTSRELVGHTAVVYTMAFSPDGTKLASAGLDTTVRLWDVHGGAPRVLSGHAGLVQEVAFSTDGKRLVSGGDDGTVRVWDLASGTAQILDHGSAVRTFALSRDGRVLFSGAADGALRLWNLDGGVLVAALRGHAAGVIAVAISDDGATLAAGSEDGDVRLWPRASTAWSAPATLAELARWSSVSLINDEALSP